MKKTPLKTIQHVDEPQPWVTCFFTDILLTYVEETTRGKTQIDYASLLRSIEGLESPSDPKAFLKDVHNWVPLAVLTELLGQCEKISGRKDIAYHAARAYFDRRKRRLPSLFEIIARVLSDVRSVLIYVNLWGAVQTNFLRLQAFEKQNTQSGLYILAQFDEKARPTVGIMHMLQGILEGFPGLYSFIQDVQCIDELTQSRIEDILREFPDYVLIRKGDRLSVCRRGSKEPTVEAIVISLKTEFISPSREFMSVMPEALVVAPYDGQIGVLSHRGETDPHKKSRAPRAYKITKDGMVTHEGLSYSFETGQIYDAPYSRVRFVWKEGVKPQREITLAHVKKEVSRLLLDYLEQMKRNQVRAIQDNIEKRRLNLENIYLRREVEREYSFGGIVGTSDKIRELIALVHSVAAMDVTVLIQGETGTGKELIAKAIHYNSPRRMKRCVAVNCGSLTETLLESELFGHEKGAFTGAITQRKGIFESADGGTLFLDEIGEIPPSTQVKLLRVLQEGEFQRVGGTHVIKVNVRIVAATNQNLEKLVTQGCFRQDLYYRLNVVPIRVPPLRERAEDIPLLISHFIEKRNPQLNQRIRGMSPQAMAFAMAHRWPGNVRELENVIQRMMVIAKGEILDVQDLPPEIRGKEAPRREKAKDLKDVARESAGMVEKRAILDALAKSGGNVTQAARSLGVSRVTLQKKMKIHNLREPSRQDPSS